MKVRITLEMFALSDNTSDVVDSIYRAYIAFANQRLTCDATSQDGVSIYNYTDILGNLCTITTAKQ